MAIATPGSESAISSRLSAHAAAAGLLRGARGPVVVSGYPSALYAELYEAHGWTRHERVFVTNSGGRKVEAVWVNR